jgi:hypothetical protein
MKAILLLQKEEEEKYVCLKNNLQLQSYSLDVSCLLGHGRELDFQLHWRQYQSTRKRGGGHSI